MFFTKEKIHAFLVHLAISLVIFLVLLYYILYEWYPFPLFQTDGGWQGIRLIAFVDIVLGPLLTLVVYKKAKKRLKLDLSIIAAIQLIALFSGTYVVYNEHPVAVVLMNNRLATITVTQVNSAKIELESLGTYSNLQPPLIYINLPSDPQEYAVIIREEFIAGIGLRLYEKGYQKLSKNKVKIIAGSMDIDSFVQLKQSDKLVFKKFLEMNKFETLSLIYFPIYSRYKRGIAVLDEQTFELLDIIDITPPDISHNYPTKGG